MTTNRVSDIHGEQIQVDGRWFHAERIFGTPAAHYGVGQLVKELAEAAAPPAGSGSLAEAPPDELVSCALYRGCSSNEMTEEKVSAFVQIMLSAGGLGAFPMVTGYVEVLDAHDVEQCERLAAEGRSDVWLAEMGWSRVVTAADVGARYLHVDNGHHRMAAAAIASAELGPIYAPCADRRREEDLPRFVAMRP